MKLRPPQRLAGLAVLALGALGPARAAPAEPAAPLRVLVAGGALGSERLREHLEFARAAGFNAVWVRSAQAGRWTREDAPDGPSLGPEFVELARWCAARELRTFLELRPVEDARGGRLFSDRAALKRLLGFAHLARERAGVRDFVLSFAGAGQETEDLSDLVSLGRGAAPLHLEMAKRLAGALKEPVRLWFRAAISSDAELDAPDSRYAADLLHGLSDLPTRVGLVWSGAKPASPTQTAATLRASRARLGGREILLLDPFPPRAQGSPAPLALVLGALEGREPGIVREIAGYVSVPGDALGGSRLSLLTVADFLRDPSVYDAARSLRAAIERLAGPNEAAIYALRTQAAEWGGWIGGGGYHTTRTDSPHAAALGLADPAIVAGWTWTARRYPERMEALGAVADVRFREDLLETMARRLAVAEAVPVVVELLARRAAEGGDPAPLERELETRRASLAGQPAVREALDRFLQHAGVLRETSP